jgi:hypothetical protein
MILAIQMALFWAFMVVWTALGIWSGYFFWQCRNARVKRAIYPWFVGLTCFLFCLFILVVFPKGWALLFAIPIAVLIALQMLWMTRFCDSCGITIQRGRWFLRLRYCPSCGAPLDRRGRSPVSPTVERNIGSEQ